MIVDCMGFKRPEVRIFSPRRPGALKINGSRFFYVFEMAEKIPENTLKNMSTTHILPTKKAPDFSGACCLVCALNLLYPIAEVKIESSISQEIFEAFELSVICSSSLAVIPGI